MLRSHLPVFIWNNNNTTVIARMHNAQIQIWYRIFTEMYHFQSAVITVTIFDYFTKWQQKNGMRQRIGIDWSNRRCKKRRATSNQQHIAFRVQCENLEWRIVCTYNIMFAQLFYTILFYLAVTTNTTENTSTFV